MKNKYEQEYFTSIIKKSFNLSEAARNLGLSTGHGNRQTVKKYIDVYNIDVSHFIITAGNHNNFIKNDLSDILVEESYYGTTHLKNRLFKEGLKEKKCEICGQEETWYNSKIVFILDHINGINNDHRLDNLRILCPNCNSTLDTNCGKNKNRTNKYNNYNKISKKYKNIIDKVNKCKCGEIINKHAKHCKSCHYKDTRKVKRPPYEDLINEINTLGYVGTGKKYNVSDNAIRKWKKNYEK